MNKLLTILFVFLLGAPYAGFAQCSGRFDLTYPSGSTTTTTSTNSGAGTASATYCPLMPGEPGFLTVFAQSPSNLTLETTGATTTLIGSATLGANGSTTFILPASMVSVTYRLTSTIICNNPKPETFTLTLAPTLTLSATLTQVCLGGNTTLTSTGSNTGNYTWSAPGMTTVTTTGSLTVAPTATTTYTLTAPTSCSGTTQQQITVVVPAITVGPASASVAPGGSTTLTASSNIAGATFEWRTGGSTGPVVGTGASFTATPEATTTYTVTSTTASGCSYSRNVTVTVTAPLPVTLTSFTARAAGSTSRLAWTTANELNNAYFAVERSADGQTFTALAQVEGAGTTSAARAYAFTDERPLAKGNYYRLQQVDFSGKAAYSPVVFVAGGPVSSDWLVPTASPRQYAVRGLLDANSRLTVLDVLGRPLYSQAVSPERATVDLPALPTGVYLFRLTTSQGRYTIRQALTGTASN